MPHPISPRPGTEEKEGPSTQSQRKGYSFSPQWVKHGMEKERRR